LLVEFELDVEAVVPDVGGRDVTLLVEFELDVEAVEEAVAEIRSELLYLT
jgi:hypothetical protein